MTDIKEGGLEAPTRYPIKWKKKEFHDEGEFFLEAERVFDICHGCRRCVNLCESFPILFDLIDESKTMEIDSVKKGDFFKVVDECYMCDLCYQTKCPYVPPHPWALDFPHLMLRGKSISYKKNIKGTLKRLRDKFITSTDTLGKFLNLPLIGSIFDFYRKSKFLRKISEQLTGLHKDGLLPKFNKRLIKIQENLEIGINPSGRTSGKVSVFIGCHCRNSEPQIVEDLIKVLQHNDVAVNLIKNEKCCGMPKLDLGDLESVENQMIHNAPILHKEIESDRDIIALVPSCVLMFKQELPLMFEGNKDLINIKEHIFDPFEYFSERNKEGKLKKEFKVPLGKVGYQVACHQRVQNIGPKTKEILEMIPETKVETIERCSGHDGTYAIKLETHKNSIKIAKPVVNKIDSIDADHFTSDCPLAAKYIRQLSKSLSDHHHPISLLKKAYGIK